MPSHLPPDTLIINRDLVTDWAADYDYVTQLTAPRRNWWQEFMRWLSDVINDTVIAFSNLSLTDSLYFIAGVLLLMGLCYIGWRNRERWFAPLMSRRKQVAYAVSDDSIYGQDFDALLRQAWQDGNYGECVRLIYLRHLRRLSDNRLIDWQPRRTPDTYIAQLQPGADRDSLCRLTQVYVRVRYGHYPATRDEVERLAQEEGGSL